MGWAVCICPEKLLVITGYKTVQVIARFWIKSCFKAGIVRLEHRMSRWYILDWPVSILVPFSWTVFGTVLGSHLSFQKGQNPHMLSSCDSCSRLVSWLAVVHWLLLACRTWESRAATVMVYAIAALSCNWYGYNHSQDWETCEGRTKYNQDAN